MVTEGLLYDWCWGFMFPWDLIDRFNRCKCDESTCVHEDNWSDICRPSEYLELVRIYEAHVVYGPWSARRIARALRRQNGLLQRKTSVDGEVPPEGWGWWNDGYLGGARENGRIEERLVSVEEQHPKMWCPTEGEIEKMKRDYYRRMRRRSRSIDGLAEGKTKVIPEFDTTEFLNRIKVSWEIRVREIEGWMTLAQMATYTLEEYREEYYKEKWMGARITPWRIGPSGERVEVLRWELVPQVTAQSILQRKRKKWKNMLLSVDFSWDTDFNEASKDMRHKKIEEYKVMENAILTEYLGGGGPRLVERGGCVGEYGTLAMIFCV
jgi:hypothetical protein